MVAEVHSRPCGYGKRSCWSASGDRGEALLGTGVVTVEASGEDITVLNRASASAKMPCEITSPCEAWVSVEVGGLLVVDFHGDSVWEKTTFALAVDGQLAAVLEPRMKNSSQILAV